MLDKITSLYEQELDVALDRLGARSATVMMMLWGALGGAVVVAAYLLFSK